MRPPFTQPSGPRVPDAAVVDAFARGEPTGHSPRLHAEANVLLADRADTVALRLVPRALLVRVDGRRRRRPSCRSWSKR